MAVALDVAALAAHDEEDELLVAGVRDLARRRGLDVDEPIVKTAVPRCTK
jgi:hypothetical protein